MPRSHHLPAFTWTLSIFLAAYLSSKLLRFFNKSVRLFFGRLVRQELTFVCMLHLLTGKNISSNQDDTSHSNSASNITHCKVDDVMVHDCRLSPATTFAFFGICWQWCSPGLNNLHQIFLISQPNKSSPPGTVTALKCPLLCLSGWHGPGQELLTWHPLLKTYPSLSARTG